MQVRRCLMWLWQLGVEALSQHHNLSAQKPLLTLHLVWFQLYSIPSLQIFSVIYVHHKQQSVTRALRLLDVDPQSSSGVAMAPLHQRWHCLWLKSVVLCYNTRIPGHSSGEMIVIRVLYYCCTRGNRAKRKRINMANSTRSAKKLFEQLHKLPLIIRHPAIDRFRPLKCWSDSLMYQEALCGVTS
jgi:hypothetical protein